MLTVEHLIFVGKCNNKFELEKPVGLLLTVIPETFGTLLQLNCIEHVLFSNSKRKLSRIEECISCFLYDYSDKSLALEFWRKHVWAVNV